MESGIVDYSASPEESGRVSPDHEKQKDTESLNVQYKLLCANHQRNQGFLMRYREK